MTSGENIVKSSSMETSIHKFITTIEPFFGWLLAAPFMIGTAALLYIAFKGAVGSSLSSPVWIKLKELFNPLPVYCPNCKSKMAYMAMWVDDYYKCWNCNSTFDHEDI